MWLLAVEFQYNDKKHLTIKYILFKVNFERYLWKRNLMIKIKIPKLETFFRKTIKILENSKLFMKRYKENNEEVI